MMSDSAAATSTALPTRSTVATQQWRCDVCKLVSFPTFDEACRHEDACRKIKEAGNKKKQKRAASSSRVATTVGAAANKRKKSATTTVSCFSSSSAGAAAVLLDLSQDTDDSTAVDAAAAAVDKDDDEVQVQKVVIANPPPANKRKAGKRKAAISVPPPLAALILSGAAADDASLSCTLILSEADQRAVLAEHATAEFRAKRLQNQQRQRERQLNKKTSKSTASLAAAAPATAAVAQSCPSPKPRRGAMEARAVCFPVPSHVIPSTSADALIGSAQCQPLLVSSCSMQQESTESIPISNSSPDSPPLPEYRYLFSGSSSSEHVQERLLHDPIRRVLTSILRPPPIATVASSLLWVDQDYYYSTASNAVSNVKQNTRSQLPTHLEIPHELTTAFLQQWKQLRHQANQRGQERQRKLANPNQKKKSRLTKRSKPPARRRRRLCESEDEDDFLWDDEEYDDDNENDQRLSSLCLLTGPVGCGKTQLVHQVARECDCPVLEINTTEKRGAAALRKILEEATQSQSLLTTTTTTTTARKNEFFAAKTKREELLDSDDEGRAGKTANLTLILIDEVDILFEQHGDNGFWAALLDLSKRSKSPIFLTANSVPPALASVRLEHIEIEKPTPSQCLPTLKRLLDSHGFVVTSEHDLQRQLEWFAQLCNCDIRRMTHELQSFAFAHDHHALTCSGPKRESSCGQALAPALTWPTITEIVPGGVRAEDYTLITIRGTGFAKLVASADAESLKAGYPVRVHIGHELCPLARIMNDQTILAVVPPFAFPETSTKATCRANSVQFRHYSAEYPPVFLSSVRRLGAVSTTARGVVLPSQLPDGRFRIGRESTLFLERHFSTVTGHRSPSPTDDEEFEMDFKQDSTTLCSTGMATKVVNSISLLDYQKASELMHEAVKKWSKEIPSLTDSLVRPKIDDEAACISIEATSQAADLASDAVWMEEVGSCGLPFLSGSCRGFGFYLTDAFPAATNQNSKPPTEERLFADGWKDNCYFYGGSDCYMTLPVLAREVKLGKDMAASIRGYAVEQVDTAETQDIVVVDDEDAVAVDHAPIQAHHSEEEFFLYNPCPQALTTLPIYLLSKANEKIENTDYYQEFLFRELLFDQERANKMETFLEIADSFYHELPYQLQILSVSLCRLIDPLLGTCTSSWWEAAMDSKVFLDYLPMLRIMGVQEQVNFMMTRREEFDLTTDTNGDFSARRTTRQSKKRQRENYFLHLLHRSMWHVDDGQAEEMNNRLAASCLTVASSKLDG